MSVLLQPDLREAFLFDDMNEDLSGYQLSRDWFEWCFMNSEIISPNHSALYFYIINLANKMHWKPVFGLPTEVAKEAIGIRNYKTYKKTLEDLVSFGFVKLVQESKNQYTCNMIALVKNDKANGEAHDKATLKHLPKQVQSTYQGIDSIIKHTKHTKHKNIETLSVESDLHPMDLPEQKNDVSPESVSEKKSKTEGDHDFCAGALSIFTEVTGKSRILNKGREGMLMKIKKSKYTLEDIRAVCVSKYNEWKDDPKMEKHIEPDTLFRPVHFESYLEIAREKLASPVQKDFPPPPRMHHDYKYYEYDWNLYCQKNPGHPHQKLPNPYEQPYKSPFEP